MIYSKLLSKHPEVFHGFTTKNFNRSIKNLVLAEQIHKDKIYQVKNKDRNKIIKGVDGLLTKKKGINLGIHTADCLPILFYEPKAKIVAAVHAGWKGTLLVISSKMVKKIESLGGKAKNIIAVTGPHIRMCCYDVPKERACLFEEKFGKDPRIISTIEGKPHLDLGYVNFLQLLKTGLKKDNLEVLPSCTFCNRQFFSFRRSKKEGDSYGEMLSIIGLL